MMASQQQAIRVSPEVPPRESPKGVEWVSEGTASHSNRKWKQMKQ